MSSTRVYLDNAATSFPKPPGVIEAVRRAMVELGAPLGRGSYAEATLVEREIAAVRRSVAALLGCPAPERVVFTASGTDSLHVALEGLVRPGDYVVTGEADHNSVLRPLFAMQERIGVTVTIVPCDGAGRLDPDDVARAVRLRPTRLVAVTAASNVTGAIQPLPEIVAIARAAGALVLADACQTVGHVPVSLEGLDADVLAASGHKGLLGPLGTGVLLVGPRAAEAIRAVRPGGTGSRSDELAQPGTFPDRLESGNLNVPGVLGLGAGVAYLREEGVARLADRAEAQIEHLVTRLETLPGATVLPPWGGRACCRGAGREASPSEGADDRVRDRVGLVSVTLDGYDPREAAAVLDASFRVQVRAGLHCAPLVHRRLRTADRGGTIRFSVGPFTTDRDVAAAAEAVAALVGGDEE